MGIMIVAMTRKPDTAGQQSEDVKNGVAQIPPEKHSRLLGRIGELARTCPKYVALSIALTEAFRDGTWKKGDKLPPEIDLASLTGLSLGTAQKAYRALVDDGFISRQQGKGTFVTDPTPPLEEPWHCRFVDEDGVLLRVVPETLERFHSEEPGPWNAFLGVPRLAPLLVIDRRLRIGDAFFVFQRVRLKPGTTPELEACTLLEMDRINFKEAICRSIGLPLTRINHRLRVVPLPHTIAETLETPVTTVGLFVEATASAGSMTPIYHQQIWVPPTNYAMALTDFAG